VGTPQLYLLATISSPLSRSRALSPSLQVSQLVNALHVVRSAPPQQIFHLVQHRRPCCSSDGWPTLTTLPATQLFHVVGALSRPEKGLLFWARLAAGQTSPGSAHPSSPNSARSLPRSSARLPRISPPLCHSGTGLPTWPSLRTSSTVSSLAPCSLPCRRNRTEAQVAELGNALTPALPPHPNSVA
jgi:hypothetical protein